MEFSICDRLLAGAALALGAAHALGQPAGVSGRQGALLLEEIIVTADRRGSYSADLVQAGNFRGARQLDTPLTVNVIPDALLQSQQAQGLLDALRNVAGVSPAQTSTIVYSNIAIRGIEVENRSNYRLNGVLPIVNLIDLPLEDKDRVETLKGASALYYGFTTPAGVVNLTLKRALTEPYLAAALAGNQYGALTGHIDASKRWGGFGARVNALYGSVDSGIDHTRGDRSLLAAALDFKPRDELSMTLDAEHIVKRVTEPGVYRYTRIPAPTVEDLYPALQLPPLLDPTSNFGPDWAENRAQERNVLASATWRISPSWSVSGSYGVSRLIRDRRFNTIDLNTYGPDTDGNGRLSINLQPGATLDNTSYRIEMTGVVDLWFTQHELLVGASRNLRDAFTSRSTPALCPGAAPSTSAVCLQNIFQPIDIPETPFPAKTGARSRIDDIGYYIFDRISLTPSVDVLAGVRKADYRETDRDSGATRFQDDPIAVSYGVLIKPRSWISVYGTYIEGLESTPLAPASAANAGASLPAANSTQVEAGVKLEPRRGLLVQAAYFDIERGSAYVNARNVYVLDGRARYRGAELSITGEPTPDWSVYATAQLLDAEQISGADTQIETDPISGAVTVTPTIVGRKIDNTPERTFSLATEYRFSRLLEGFSINAGAYYLSERAVNPLNQAFISSYTLYDVGAAYSTMVEGRELTLRLMGQNIGQKRHFSSTGGNVIAQAPPRLVKLSMSMRF